MSVLNLDEIIQRKWESDNEMIGKLWDLLSDDENVITTKSDNSKLLEIIELHTFFVGQVKALLKSNSVRHVEEYLEDHIYNMIANVSTRFAEAICLNINDKLTHENMYTLINIVENFNGYSKIFKFIENCETTLFVYPKRKLVLKLNTKNNKKAKVFVDLEAKDDDVDKPNSDDDAFIDNAFIDDSNDKK
jgi:hypothetical protein